MVRRWGLAGVVVAMVAVAVAVAQEIVVRQEPSVMRVKGALSDPEMPVVTVVGVCDITAEAVRCWDLEGKPFKTLGERIWATYLSQSYASLQIKPGAKNRWVAFERDLTTKPTTWYWGSFTNSSGSQQQSNWRTGKMLEWVRIDALPEDTLGMVQAQLYRTFPPVTMPMKRGARMELAGRTVEMVSFGTAPKPTPNAHMMGWGHLPYQVVLRVDGEFPMTMPSAQPVAKNGKPFQQVDRRGRPVPWDGIGFANRQMSAQFSQLRTEGQNRIYQTNIDPREIGTLQFIRQENRVVEFIDLPLDPTPVR